MSGPWFRNVEVRGSAQWKLPNGEVSDRIRLSDGPSEHISGAFNHLGSARVSEVAELIDADRERTFHDEGAVIEGAMRHVSALAGEDDFASDELAVGVRVAAENDALALENLSLIVGHDDSPSPADDESARPESIA